MKIYDSVRRKELDISFLETCLEDEIIPSFIFKTKVHECLLSEDIRVIHRRILRRSLELEKRRRKSLVIELSLVRMSLYKVTSEFCFHLCVKYSVKLTQKLINSKIISQEKKLFNLRKLFGVCKFNVKNTVLNKSSIELSDEEYKILQFGPNHSIMNRIDDNRLKVKIEGAFFYLSKFSKDLDIKYLKHALNVKSMDYLKKNRKQDIKDFHVEIHHWSDNNI